MAASPREPKSSRSQRNARSAAPSSTAHAHQRLRDTGATASHDAEQQLRETQSVLLALTENTQNVLQELRSDRDSLKREVSSLRRTLEEASEGGLRASSQMEGLTLHCRDLEHENRQLVAQLESPERGGSGKSPSREESSASEDVTDAVADRIVGEWRRLSHDWRSQEVAVEELSRHKEQLVAQVRQRSLKCSRRWCLECPVPPARLGRTRASRLRWLSRPNRAATPPQPQVKDMQHALVEVAQEVETGSAGRLAPAALAAAVTAEQRAAERWRQENTRLAAELAQARTQLAELSTVGHPHATGGSSGEPSGEMLCVAGQARGPSAA